MPSPWVATRTQIQFTISSSSSRVESVATEVVTVDAVNMSKWEKWDLCGMEIGPEM